jgi:hypothetical protein
MPTKTKPEADQPHVRAQDEPEPDAEKGALFDKADFNDPRLLLEDERGNKIDEIVLTFTGRVKLNRHDVPSVRYAKGVILSRFNDVDFQLSGNWIGRQVKLNPEREDGGGGERVLELKAQIHSITLDEPSDADIELDPADVTEE